MKINWHWTDWRFVSDYGSVLYLDLKSWGLGINFMWFNFYRGMEIKFGPLIFSLGFDHVDNFDE